MKCGCGDVCVYLCACEYVCWKPILRIEPCRRSELKQQYPRNTNKRLNIKGKDKAVTKKNGEGLCLRRGNEVEWKQNQDFPRQEQFELLTLRYLKSLHKCFPAGEPLLESEQSKDHGIGGFMYSMGLAKRFIGAQRRKDKTQCGLRESCITVELLLLPSHSSTEVHIPVLKSSALNSRVAAGRAFGSCYSVDIL